MGVADFNLQPGKHDAGGERAKNERESTQLELADWRAKIDIIDEQIVKLISERAAAANAIGELKHRDGLAVYEPKREQTVIDHVCRVNPGPLPNAEMAHIYERLMDVMRSLQKKG